MDILNYSTPVAVAASFAVTYVYDVCTVHKSQPVRILSKRRIPFLCLSSAITISFVARAIEYARNSSAASESSFVHTLSQTLLWITLCLAISSSASLPSLPYLTTWLLTFLVEVVICGTTYMRLEDQHMRPTTDVQLGLQIITSILALTLFCLGLFTIQRCIRIELTEETQSLLRAGAEPRSYSSDASHSDDETTVDNESSSEDADEKELKAIRDKKLQEAGGWAPYLATFSIFLPFIIPMKQLRLQLCVLIILIVTLLRRALNVLRPVQLGAIIDNLQRGQGIPWINVSLWILYTLLSSPNCGIGAINDFLQARLTAWSRQQIHLAAFDKVMSLSMSFHDSKESGEIIKAIEQAGSLSSLFRLLITDILPGTLDIVIAMWYIYHLLDIYATHIVIVVVIAFVFTTVHTSKLAAEALRNNTAAERDESKLIYETICNWSIVSYFNRRQHETTRLGKVLCEVSKTQVRINDFFTLMFGAHELCEQVGRFAVSLLAMYRISLGTLSVGSFVALESYWDTITMPLYSLEYSYREISSDMISAERLMQLFETEVTVKEKSNAYRFDADKGEIEFQDVKFAYEGRDKTITDLNFKAQAGQTIAIVGETGSGKSTMFKLLMRFYDIQSGRITIDGQNIADATISSLRDIFGFVPQDSVLFNTTILDNVKYGRLDATNEEVYEACRAACIHDKIMSFPAGYQSKVGERGVKMSGGERQRIAIARVLLRNPQIVLLDEATSAMDSQTESKIQTALRRLINGRTALVIAHRLSTIVEADMILVLDGGKVIERGTHNELVKAGGRYLELWAKQSAQGSDPEMSAEESKP